jgi:hypothetical protein
MLDAEVAQWLPDSPAVVSKPDSEKGPAKAVVNPDTLPARTTRWGGADILSESTQSHVEATTGASLAEEMLRWPLSKSCPLREMKADANTFGSTLGMSHLLKGSPENRHGCETAEFDVSGAEALEGVTDEVLPNIP